MLGLALCNEYMPCGKASDRREKFALSGCAWGSQTTCSITRSCMRLCICVQPASLFLTKLSEQLRVAAVKVSNDFARLEACEYQSISLLLTWIRGVVAPTCDYRI